MTASEEPVALPDRPIATHSVADGHETAAADIDEGFANGSAIPKLHANGDGGSASAEAAAEPHATRLTISTMNARRLGRRAELNPAAIRRQRSVAHIRLPSILLTKYVTGPRSSNLTQSRRNDAIALPIGKRPA
jgi:hypothetical protein